MTDSEPRPFAALPAPEQDEPGPEEPRLRRALFPEGALGIFFLLLLAAASGGLIATYWPWVQGGSEASGDRISALETRVAQIAEGRAPNVAAAAYGDEEKTLAALKIRLDADEARLSAVEKSAPGDSADAGPLKSDFDQMNGRIAKLEQNAGGAASLAQLRKDLEARLQTEADATGRIGERVATLEKTAPPADLAARLDSFALKSGEDALTVRIATLENRDASEALKRAALLLALADLVRASSGGQSFATELSTMRALSPKAPELADLAKYASQPVPTATMLSAGLSDSADSILAAERASQAKTWSQKFWANLANLVSIRRVDGGAGDSTQDRIARAESDLRNGDLARAAGEMNALKGAARKAAQPWLGGAEARLAVDRDTHMLMSRLIAALPEHS